MVNNNDMQLIEDFLDGILTGEKLEYVKERLNNDTPFRDAYEQRKKLAILWKEADEYQNTKQEIQEILKTGKRGVFHYLRDNYYLYGIAASFLLLFGIYWFMIRQHNNGAPNFNNQVAATSDTLIMQQDEPREFAKVKYLNNLIMPVNNQQFSIADTLVFKWTNRPDEQKTMFYIKDRTGSKIFIQKKINSTDSLLIVEPGKLQPGSYKWFLNDSVNSEYFTINKLR
jgi:hypothetical protein